MTAKKAPRPEREDVGEKAERLDAARQVFEFTVRGESVGRLAIGNVPMLEKMEAENRTHKSWSDILGQAGVGLSITRLSIMVWLARRASGEPDLMWSTFLDSWDDTIRIDEIEFNVLEDGGDADPQP